MTDRKIKDREIDIQSTKYRVQRDREIPAHREIKRQTRIEVRGTNRKRQAAIMTERWR